MADEWRVIEKCIVFFVMVVLVGSGICTNGMKLVVAEYCCKWKIVCWPRHK